MSQGAGIVIPVMNPGLCPTPGTGGVLLSESGTDQHSSLGGALARPRLRASRQRGWNRPATAMREGPSGTSRQRGQRRQPMTE